MNFMYRVAPSVKKLIHSIVRQSVLIICKAVRLDLLPLAYYQRGIGKFETLAASGEKYLLEVELKKHLPPKAIIFDVGANSGDYTRELQRAFPGATIHAFEPNPTIFESLKQTGAVAHCIALGSQPESLDLYNYEEGTGDGGGHASLHQGVFSIVHGVDNVQSVKVQVTTLDLFCETHNIERIDYLKIDTEGHELDVLKGASRLLESGGIKAIQFEFNSMNVCSRVFLQDFYQILPGFSFYRLDSNRLIPLNDYHAENEMFAFQNIYACKQ